MGLASRHILVILGFLGFVVVYSLRVNLSVAMVAMANSSSAAVNVTPECPAEDYGNSTSKPADGEFSWDEQTQGLILGAFFWGYIVTQIPGGMLAEIYGAKWIYGIGILWTSVLTLLTPLAARWSVPVFIVLRVLEGIGEGVTFPAMHALLAQWIPPLERTKLGVFVYSGAIFGTIISLPISGFLCSSTFLGGWPSVFYLFGALGCVWFFFWCYFVYNSPRDHPRISEEELTMITTSLKDSVSRTGKLPYRKVLWYIFTSGPMWAINASVISIGWCIYLTIFSFPEYFDKILNFSVKEDGVVSCLPYISLWVSQIFSGWLADFIRAKKTVSTTAVRKWFNTVGLVCEAIGFVLVGYIGCDRILAAGALVLTLGLSGFCAGGYSMNHLDLAPQYAGTLLGITNSIATIPGMVAPVVVGAFTNHNQTRAQWVKVFYTSSAITLFGGLVFLALGSGELQSWAADKEDNEPILSQEEPTNSGFEDSGLGPRYISADIQT